MTTILEPSFETISNWTSSIKTSSIYGVCSVSQTNEWSSDGLYSIKFLWDGFIPPSCTDINGDGIGDCNYLKGDYTRISQNINISSDFILRFDYRFIQCDNPLPSTYDGLAIRILIDDNIIETVPIYKPYGESTFITHDTSISSYSGNHTLSLEVVHNIGWGSFLDDQCIYIDNLQIIQSSDPCSGVTCPDTCVGTDLWSQTCTPIGETYQCLPSTIKEVNNITCDEYTLYYKVPWIYPTWYINSVLPFVQSFGDNILSSYPDYYISNRTYNETNKTLEIVIKRKPLPSPLQSMQTKTLVGFVPLALVFVALEILTGIAILLYGTKYSGTKKGKGIAPTNRSVKVTVQTCTPTCVPMSVPVSLEYTIEGIDYTQTIPVGTPSISFSIPNNIDVNFTAKADGYVNKNKTLICETGIGQCDLNIEFAPTENASGTVAPIDDTGAPVTCGSYQFILVDNNTELASGPLDASGKTPEITFPADQKIAATIVPCDTSNLKPNTVIFKLSSGQKMTVENIIGTCLKAKNGISVLSQYTSQDGSLIQFTPDKITVSSKTTSTYTKGTDYKNSDYVYVINGLEKNTQYTVSIEASGYPILNNNQQTSFDTDCFTTKQILFKATTPINTKDFIITVIDTNTSQPVINADVFLDSSPIGFQTNTLGNTETFIGIPYGKHTIKITKAGYQDTTTEIDVSSESLAQYIIKMTTTSSVGTIETLIFDLKNKDDLYSRSIVQFEGYLKYLDTDLTYKSVVGADITVDIMESTTLIKSFNITTEDFPSIYPGLFTTPKWEIPSSLSKKTIDVIAKYNGSGDLQPTSYTQSFYVDEGCCLKLPLFGCIASQESCDTIKTVGYGILIAGVAYVGYKLLKPQIK